MLRNQILAMKSLITGVVADRAVLAYATNINYGGDDKSRLLGLGGGAARQRAGMVQRPSRQPASASASSSRGGKRSAGRRGGRRRGYDSDEDSEGGGDGWGSGSEEEADSRETSASDDEDGDDRNWRRATPSGGHGVRRSGRQRKQAVAVTKDAADEAELAAVEVVAEAHKRGADPAEALLSASRANRSALAAGDGLGDDDDEPDDEEDESSDDEPDDGVFRGSKLAQRSLKKAKKRAKQMQAAARKQQQQQKQPQPDTEDGEPMDDGESGDTWKVEKIVAARYADLPSTDGSPTVLQEPEGPDAGSMEAEDAKAREHDRQQLQRRLAMPEHQRRAWETLEFMVKWRNLSYLHVEWVAASLMKEQGTLM
jgi:hypothetical protein